MKSMLTASVRSSGFGVPGSGYYPDQSLEILLYTGGDVTETELNAMYADNNFKTTGYIGRVAQNQILSATRTLLGRLYVPTFSAYQKISESATLMRLSSLSTPITPIANGLAGLAVFNKCSSNGVSAPDTDGTYTKIALAFFLTVSDTAGDGDLKMQNPTVSTAKNYRFNDITLNHSIEVPVI